MSDPNDPLNTAAPRGEDDAEPMGTLAAFELTARMEHMTAKHTAAFEDCQETDCVQAREMLDGAT